MKRIACFAIGAGMLLLALAVPAQEAARPQLKPSAPTPAILPFAPFSEERGASIEAFKKEAPPLAAAFERGTHTSALGETMPYRLFRPRVEPGKKYPLVLFLHGRHATCYYPGPDASVTGDWPCPEGTLPIPSHLGYRYAAEILASQGYLTVSISANGVNGQDGWVADANYACLTGVAQMSLNWTRLAQATGAQTTPPNCIHPATSTILWTRRSMHCAPGWLKKWAGISSLRWRTHTPR